MLELWVSGRPLHVIKVPAIPRAELLIRLPTTIAMIIHGHAQEIDHLSS